MASKYADQKEKLDTIPALSQELSLGFRSRLKKGCGAKCGVEPQLLAEIERRPTCAGRKLRYSFLDGIREAIRLELP
jgi:hypothetical protein